MTALFLQARLASSRLPRKALLRLENRTVIEHCMAALGYVQCDRHVLLTDAESKPEFEPLAQMWGFETCAGDPDDVLARFARAVEYYGVDTVIRATGDNPLVSASLANRILREHLDTGSDYSGYLGMPLGTGVEVMSGTAILSADRSATSQYDREHVAPYIYHNPREFRTHRPTVEASIQLDRRVTLDTSDDLALLRTLFERLYRGLPVEITELVEELRALDSPHRQSA